MNVNTMCRVCETLHDLTNIFDEENEGLLIMLRSVAEVSVDLTDTLPKHICTLCSDKLRQAFDFIQQCKATDYKLREEATKENAEEAPSIETVIFYTTTDSLSPLDSPKNVDEADLIERDENVDVDDFYHLESVENSQASDNTRDLVDDEFIEECKSVKSEGESVDADEFDDVMDEAFDNFIVEEVEPIEICTVVEQKAVTDTSTSVASLFVDGKVYKSDSCSETFNNSQDLNAHKKSHHGEIRFECPTCQKCFSRRYRLRDHMLTHGNPVKLPCNLCSKTYTNQNNLDRHIKHFHNRERPHACDICGQCFARKDTLMTHMSKHVDTRDFECEKCDKKFKSAYYLRVHLKSHVPVELRTHRRKPAKRKHRLCICAQCGRELTSISAYQKHMRTHTGEKPYECPHCAKRFPFKHTLNTHMLLHSGEKPYKCDICAMSFRQSGHLKGHKMAVHAGVKDHKCQYCGKSFALRSNLTIHERLHTGEKPYACNLCSKRFNDSNGLKRHNLSHIRNGQMEAVGGGAAAIMEPTVDGQEIMAQEETDIKISIEEDQKGVFLIKDPNELNQLNVSYDVYLGELGTEYTEIIESEATLEQS